MNKINSLLQAVSLAIVLGLSGCTNASADIHSSDAVQSSSEPADAQVTSASESTPSLPSETSVLQSSPADFSLADAPAYEGSPYVVINNNVPYFTDGDLTSSSYEYYSDLDALGRCGPAVASIGKDLMPSGERESIGMIKPSGWHTVKYDGIDGSYLYNRCHLIGYQLTGENANEKNLITGTRYLNIEGMLPYENMTADYIKETNNHVLYRVTPVFDGNDLVAHGVLMEAESVEDHGEGILFCVYCYNVQPGITIDYATGDSVQNGSSIQQTAVTPSPEQKQPESVPSGEVYIGNANTKKFHHSWCSSVDQMNDANKVEFATRDEAIAAGYEPCKRCNP